MTSTPNGVPSFAVPNGTCQPQLRPQFRRQGSSFGGHGHVHNMAVMVVPNKVDYSVTKGGVRLWAVLFVFIFLCSAMLTIFTEVDDDDDHALHSTTFNDLDEDTIEPLTPTHRVEDDDLDEDEKATNPPDRGPISHQSQRQEAPVPQAVNTAADDDEDVEEDEEEILFARLREKANRRKHMASSSPHPPTPVVEEEDDSEEVQTPPPPQPKAHRRHRQPKKTVNEEAETEPEETTHEPPPPPVQTKKSRRRKSRPVEVSDEDEEEEQVSEIPAAAPTTTDGTEEAEEEDEDVDDGEPAPTAQPRAKSVSKPVKRKASSWHRSVNAEQEPSPRKNLLKHKKRKQQRAESPDDEDDNEHEEQEEEVSEEETAPRSAPPSTPKHTEVNDVVSTRKRSTPYNRKAITNRDDYKHRNKLDSADFLLEKHEFAKATAMFDQVLQVAPESPRARYGKARILQLRSEFENNDHLLDPAIAEYQTVLDDDNTPEALFRIAAEHTVECARFRGNLHKVMTVQRALIDRFPEDLQLQNDFGVTFLMMNRIEDARNVFGAVLETQPNNPLAQAYFGFILKVHENQLERGVHFMRRGLRASRDSIVDAKFYFHLGDGLMRLGRQQEAMRVYEEATHLGLFPSPLQRSTHNLEGLTARPWWTLDQTNCAKHLKQLERQWTAMREEALALWHRHEALFEPEDPHLTDGSQVAFPFTRNGVFDEPNCKLAPITCELLKNFVREASCYKGEARLSVLSASSRIWPHCCPTNYVLEAQLGLTVPSEARIRVANDVRGWKTGKFLVFDESFEHEIWFDGASAGTLRIVLSLDLWHPQVPYASRSDIVMP